MAYFDARLKHKFYLQIEAAAAKVSRSLARNLGLILMVRRCASALRRSRGGFAGGICLSNCLRTGSDGECASDPFGSLC